MKDPNGYHIGFGQKMIDSIHYFLQIMTEQEISYEV